MMSSQFAYAHTVAYFVSTLHLGIDSLQFLKDIRALVMQSLLVSVALHKAASKSQNFVFDTLLIYTLVG